MINQPINEVTIVGAGISGLLISRHLTDQGTLVTLVGPEDKRQQTLCTWRNVQAPDFYNEHLIGAWSSWQFRAKNKKIIHQADKYWYEALNGLSLKRSLENYLSEQPTFTRIQELVNTVKKTKNSFEINTSSGSITSSYLLDSRPPQFKEQTLTQQFFGVAIEYERAEEIANHPILMDFNIHQIDRGCVMFVYVIPLTSKSMLVEATLFGTSTVEESILRNLVQQWIEDHCNTDYLNKSPIFEEKGIIPMGPVSFTNNGKPAGIAAGSARQSSGYALQGLERQINRSKESNDLDSLSNSPYSHLSTWMDKVFLRVIRHNPILGKEIFSAMAQSLTGDEFANFMADDFSFKDSLKIIRALPKFPFIRAILSE